VVRPSRHGCFQGLLPVRFCQVRQAWASTGRVQEQKKKGSKGLGQVSRRGSWMGLNCLDQQLPRTRAHTLRCRHMLHSTWKLLVSVDTLQWAVACLPTGLRCTCHIEHRVRVAAFVSEHMLLLSRGTDHASGHAPKCLCAKHPCAAALLLPT
jgi:hypothetical protein